MTALRKYHQRAIYTPTHSIGLCFFFQRFIHNYCSCSLWRFFLLLHKQVCQICSIKVIYTLRQIHHASYSRRCLVRRPVYRSSGSVHVIGTMLSKQYLHVAMAAPNALEWCRADRLKINAYHDRSCDKMQSALILYRRFFAVVIDYRGVKICKRLLLLVVALF